MRISFYIGVSKLIVKKVLNGGIRKYRHSFFVSATYILKIKVVKEKKVSSTFNFKVASSTLRSSLLYSLVKYFFHDLLENKKKFGVTGTLVENAYS